MDLRRHGGHGSAIDASRCQQVTGQFFFLNLLGSLLGVIASLILPPPFSPHLHDAAPRIKVSAVVQALDRNASAARGSAHGATSAVHRADVN